MVTKILLFLTLIMSQIVIADESSSITAIGFAPHPAIEQHYLHIVKNSYAKLGLYPDFIPASDKRSLKMLRQNKLDALVIRTENILVQHTELIKVPPMLGAVDIALICQKKITCNTLVLDDPNKVLGVVGLKAYYQDLLESRIINIYEVGDYERMGKMFKQYKLDAMIMVSDLNTQDSSFLQLNSYTLEKRQGFHMINKRFKHLVPQLSQALEESLTEHNFDKK